MLILLLLLYMLYFFSLAVVYAPLDLNMDYFLIDAQLEVMEHMCP